MPNRFLDLVVCLVALVVAPTATGGETAALMLAQAASPTRYERVRLAQPKNAETIHDNSGAVPVEVLLQPPLDTKAGHRLRVLLDNTLLPESWSAPRFSLQQVERGTHQLQVIVTDGEGNELGRSASIEFYMWQASRLFRPRPLK